MEDEQFFDEAQDFQQGPEYNPPYNLDEALDMASDEQLGIYNSIISRPVGVYVIYGEVGVGKSFLLNMLHAGSEQRQYKVQN